MRAFTVMFRLHQFEALAAIGASLLAGSFALFIWFTTESLGVPMTCVNGWLIDGPIARPECSSQMTVWATTFAGSADSLLSVLLPLPFIVGVLAGAPLIGREIESGSALTTWWLFPSRRRWLLRQVAAVGVPVLLALVAVALAADLVADLDHAWGIPAFTRIGQHGVGLVARGVGAFGIGLLMGAVVGRTLPGFVTAAVLAGLLLVALNLVRSEWLKAQPLTIIGRPDASGELVIEPMSVFSDWGWMAPDGTPSRDNGPGYESVMLGISETEAMGWAPIEGGVYALVGVLGSTGATLVIARRRPT